MMLDPNERPFCTLPNGKFVIHHKSLIKKSQSKTIIRNP